jgi:apolipoprotein N-acyltransferase
MLLQGRFAVIGSVLLGSVAGASFGLPFGWIASQAALVALLFILHEAQGRALDAARLAAVFSVGYFGVGYLGFALGAPEASRVLSVVCVAIVVSAQAATAGLSAWIVCKLAVGSNVRWAVLWPALWVAHESLFALGDLAMPWLRLGQQQAPDGPFASLLPVGGTLLAGACMWTLAAMAVAAMRARPAKWHWLGAAVLLVLLGVGGRWVPWTETSGAMSVALVQPGIGSEQRRSPEGMQSLLAFYRDAAAATDAVLVVTPQLAMPKSVNALPSAWLSQVQQPLVTRGADLLLGVYVEGNGEALYNGVLSLGASGTQRYLKHQLFPFGEFVPLRSLIGPWVAAAMGVTLQDTARGPREAEPLQLGGRRAALAVCFEVAFGDAWRAQAATAEFLVNMSSDGSIVSDQVSRQFMQIAQTRALEFHKPLLRSSDVNGTYAIAHQGHVLKALPPDMAAVLNASIEPRVGLTPFARFGDALPLALAALALCCCAFVVLLSRSVERQGRPSPAVRLRSQGGQVILPALGLLLVTGALFYLMVNSGQAVNEKTRVVHAADAAAYSAGIVEARSLNYQAYMNRAMVANEIAIAQLVSLGSWTWYFANAVDYIGDSVADQVFMLAPDVRAARLTAIFAATAYVLYVYTGQQASEYAHYIVDYGIGPSITVHDVVVQALSASQLAVQVNLVAGVRQGQIARDVVRAMDPNLDARVVLVSHGFDRFTKSYSRNGDDGDERGRFADVTMRSRDEFSRERNWTINGMDVPLLRNNGAMKKRGGTDLVGYDEWRAVDTLELHGQSFGCGRFGVSWCDDIRTPVGWGAVNVNAGGGDAGAGYHGNAYGENPTTADKADEDMQEPAYYSFSGLPDSRDLRDVEADAPLATGITILVHKDHADTLTSGGAAQARPAGQMALFNDRPAGARIAALSRASVFFDRLTPRADGKAEIANVYNPYWRVRLVAPTTADRAEAALSQGGLLLPSMP